MTIAELVARLSLDSSGFDSGLSGAQSKLKASTVAMGNIMAGLARSGAKMVKGIIDTGYEYNATIEQLQTSFQVMTGSAAKAENVVSQLKEMAANTPFESTDLAKTTNLLMQYGFTADDAISKMSMLGDIAQGNAEKMNGIALAYGQMSSAGKVNLQDIHQMINQGFNPLQEIADRTGESMASLYDRISKGTMQVSEITASMQAATSEGGKYYNSMVLQAKTLRGEVSTLKENWKTLTGGLIEPFTDNLQSTILPHLIDKVQELTEKLIGVDEAAALEMPDVSSQLTEWQSAFIAEWTNGLAENDDTVQEYLGKFTTITQQLKDAATERIDALGETATAEDNVKIAQLRGMKATLAQYETDLEAFMTELEGKIPTDEDLAYIDGLNQKITGIQNAISGIETGGGLTEDKVTPWSKFADAITNLAAATIDDVVKGIDWIINNGDKAKGIIEGIATAFIGFQVLKFASSAFTGIKGIIDLFGKGKNGAADVAKDAVDNFDVLRNIGDALSGIGDNTQSGAENLSQISNAIQSLTGAADGTGGVVESLQNVNDVLSSLGDESSGRAAENVRGIGSAIAETMSSMALGAEIGASEINSVLGGIGEGISGTVAGNIRAIGSAINSTLSSILAGAAARVAVINSTLSSIHGGFGGGFGGGGTTFGGGSGRGRHATGLGYVPYNNYATTLDEGEMVLTKAEAQRYRKGEKDGISTEGNYPTAAQIGAEVAKAMSGFGIDINGKRAARLMQKDTLRAQNSYAKSYALGVGK